MSWQILITLQTFVIALGLLMIRAVAKQPKANKSLLALNAIQSFFFFFGGLFLLPLLGQPFELAKVWQYGWWFVGGGILSGLANAFLFKLMSHLDAGFSSILTTLSVVFTIIFANLILHESLTKGQAIGSVILLIGICYGILVARHHHKKTKHKSAWLFGLAFGLCADVMWGLGDVNEKFVLNHMNVTTFMPVFAAAQTLVSIALAYLLEPRGFEIIKDKAIMKLNIIGGFSRSIAAVLFLLALVRSNNIALVAVVANFRLVIIILLGALILKEHQRLGQKLISATIAIVGLSIIFWK